MTLPIEDLRCVADISPLVTLTAVSRVCKEDLKLFQQQLSEFLPLQSQNPGADQRIGGRLRRAQSASRRFEHINSIRRRIEPESLDDVRTQIRDMTTFAKASPISDSQAR